MSYESYPEGYHYAFDGMYCNVDAILSQDEEDAKEADKSRLRLKLTKPLFRFEDHERILLQASKFLLREHKFKLIKNYIRIEKLPTSYANVVAQKDALQLLVSEYFRHSIGFALDIFEHSFLDSFVIKLLENANKETAYSRVADLRRLVFYILDNKNNCKQPNFNLSVNTEDTRQLLSSCRLAILINDCTNKSDSYQLEVRENTKREFAYEMSMPLENSTMPNGKKYIPRWKARHLHSLDYYANENVGKGLKRLESIDRGKDTADYVNDLIEVCLEFA
ncbi:hypothetical protein LMH66_04450 [Shewanella sp. 10N.7]|uniref:hypothetical protein n=1 Tax=Shewanella sp. 10N.7 TaxID=2885093 RepID=UPI001E294F0A|nr:hypothetical protein [Shewanella sp. 10N.7]MCC4831872.1 hypothetical protein [Shewanella sp. 10N.7]